MLHPDDIERTRRGFDLTQIGEPAIGFPNRYRHKDGSYRWISWVGVPEDGLVYCSGRDITRERIAEASLLDELGTSDLREQFVAVLGHDLRNPLAAISAGVNMLRRIHGDEAKKHQILALVDSSIGRMAGLIDNVMDFARGRLGGGIGVKLGSPEQAAPILIQVISEVRTAHPDRVVELSIDAPDRVVGIAAA
jgi:phosphoserine phosphatase RsbU/P